MSDDAEDMDVQETIKQHASESARLPSHIDQTDTDDLGPDQLAAEGEVDCEVQATDSGDLLEDQASNLEEPLTPATDSSDISKSQPGSGRVTPASQSDQSMSVSSSEKFTPHRRKRGSDVGSRQINFGSMSASSLSVKHSLFPARPGIKWRKGERLEAMDFMHKWFPAKIREINEEELQVLIHFDGWNQRFDEWVDMASDRIRPIMRHSERKEKNRKPKLEHKVGEQVYAKWTDCKMYPAKVTAVLPNGSYEVIFYDGFKKQVQPINLRAMPSEMQKKTFEINPVPEQVLKKGKFKKESLGVAVAETVDGCACIERFQSLGTVVQGSDCDTHKASGDPQPPLPASETPGTEKPKGSTRRKSGSSEKKKSCGRAGKGRLLVAGLFKGGQETAPVPAPETDTHAIGTDQDIKPDTEIKAEPVSTQTDYSKTKKEELDPAPAPLALPVPGVTPTPGISLTDTPILEASQPSNASQLVAPVPVHGSPYIPPKAFVVEADHNHFKCEYEGCNKSFRKEHLLESHVRHYHLAPPTTTTPALQPIVRKRRKTYSTCSNDSESGSIKKKKSRHMSVCDASPLLEPVMVKQEVISPALVKQETGEISTQTTPIKQEEELSMEEVLKHGAEMRQLSQDFTEESSVTDADEYLKPDELVNCICDFYEENGLMIQCEVCMCWQHASCFGITDRTLPKTYICFVCENPPGVRESSRHIHEQDWYRKGELPCFSYLAGPLPSEDRCQAIQATHSLITDLQQLNTVLHTLKLKLKILRTKDEGKLKQWRMDWDVVEAGSQLSEVEAGDTQVGMDLGQGTSSHTDESATQVGEPYNTDTPMSELSGPDSEAIVNVADIGSKMGQSLSDSVPSKDTGQTPEAAALDDDVIRKISPGLDDVSPEDADIAMETEKCTATRHSVSNGDGGAAEESGRTNAEQEASCTSEDTDSAQQVVIDHRHSAAVPEDQTGGSQEVTPNEPVADSNQTNNDQSSEVENQSKDPQSQSDDAGNGSNVIGSQPHDVESQSTGFVTQFNVLENQTDETGNQSDMEQEEGNHSDSTESVVEDPIEVCEKNLVSHILRVQAEISDRMDKIEEQLQVLEGSEISRPGQDWSRSSQKISDLPSLKRSIRNMTADLIKVKKMSVFH